MNGQFRHNPTKRELSDYLRPSFTKKEVENKDSIYVLGNWCERFMDGGSHLNHPYQTTDILLYSRRQ
jgi:hypothetical protein